jgi:FkbM family methyltransferase
MNNTESTVIYDFGANNGSNLAYYLMKAEKVVAVEANPILANLIKHKFAKEISAGRLVVENIVLVIKSSSGTVPFYIHKTKDVLSQFPKPEPDRLAAFDEIELRSKTVAELVEQHGQPYFIKIDLENFDAVILRSLFENGIRPPFISAESHSIDIFAALVAMGHYNAFKLVEGSTVSKIYSDHQVTTQNKIENHHFESHSAGPFGNDINGEWITADNFLRVLAVHNLGWRDIHATNTLIADPNYQPYRAKLEVKSLKSNWKKFARFIGLLPKR